MPGVVRKTLAVYCGSSFGTEKAFYNAAVSLGNAMAANDRPLVYGGGTSGIMGVISATVLLRGGNVTGISPYAIISAGGEKEYVTSDVSFNGQLDEAQHDKACYDGGLMDKGLHICADIFKIVVDSMHERKVEMAKRSDGFVALPGGYGTFEEVLEVTTWTQIGIHSKPVVVANVLGYWEPLRQLIDTAVKHGYIRPENAALVTFVDGPADHSEHQSYNWGEALLDALDNWTENEGLPMFDWSKRLGDNVTEAGKLAAT